VALVAAETVGDFTGLAPPQAFVVDPTEAQVSDALAHLRDGYSMETPGKGFERIKMLGERAVPTLIRTFLVHRWGDLITVASEIRSPRILPLLTVAISDHSSLAMRGVLGLAAVLDQGGLPRLATLAHHPSAAIRGSVAGAMGRPSEATGTILIELLKQDNGYWPWDGDNAVVQTVHGIALNHLRLFGEVAGSPAPLPQREWRECDSPFPSEFPNPARQPCPAYRDAELEPLRAWLHRHMHDE
jgi:hypothetical protein